MHRVLLAVLAIVCHVGARLGPTTVTNTGRIASQSLSNSLKAESDAPCDDDHVDNHCAEENETEQLRVSRGYTLPGRTLGSVRAESICACHFACKDAKGCESWVFHESGKQCELKKTKMNRSNRVKCPECIAQDMNGSVGLKCTRPNPSLCASMGGSKCGKHRKSTADRAGKWPAKKDRSWAYRDNARIYMPVDVAQKTCRVAFGHDQPAEFNLLKIPLIVKFPFLCCNACAERDDCMSWVFKNDTNKCFLKKHYDAQFSTIPCKTCIAYSSRGHYYAYQESPTAATYLRIFTSSTGHPNWKTDRFGRGSLWAPCRGGEACTFEQGFDQPEKFTLARLDDIQSAPECCAACQKRHDCKSWVWRANLRRCLLKSEFKPRLNTIPCDDCVAYTLFSQFYVYLVSWDADDVARGYSGSGALHDSRYDSYCDPSPSSTSSPSLIPPLAPDTPDPSPSPKTSPIETKHAVFDSIPSPETSYTETMRGTTGSSPSPEIPSVKTVSELPPKDPVPPFSFGYNQPARYNLPNMPLVMNHAYLCNEACKKHKSCVFWVWHKCEHECYLKNTVSKDEGKECSDCVAPSIKGLELVTDAETEEAMLEAHFGKNFDCEKRIRFGISDQWCHTGDEAAGAENSCTIVEGFDQPTEFNLGTSFKVDSASRCCHGCRKNSKCKSWVWSRTSQRCQLKNKFEKANSRIECEDCIAHHPTGSITIFSSQLVRTDDVEPSPRLPTQIENRTIAETVETPPAAKTVPSSPVDVPKDPKASVDTTGTESPASDPAPASLPVQISSEEHLPPPESRASEAKASEGVSSPSPASVSSPDIKDEEYVSPESSPLEEVPAPSQPSPEPTSSMEAPGSDPEQPKPDMQRRSQDSPVEPKPFIVAQEELVVSPSPAPELESPLPAGPVSPSPPPAESVTEPSPSPAVSMSATTVKASPAPVESITAPAEPSPVPEMKSSAYMCIFKGGFDLPGDDMNENKQLYVTRVSDCCQICSVSPSCKAWVFHDETKLCSLKTAYNPEKKRFCADCIAYTDDPDGKRWEHGLVKKKSTDHSIGNFYRQEVVKTMTDARVHTIKGLSFGPARSKEGESSSWKFPGSQWSRSPPKALPVNKIEAKIASELYPSKSETDDVKVSSGSLKQSSIDFRRGIWMFPKLIIGQCRHSTGFDQPDKFNLHDVPLIMSNAFECCNACINDSGCVSWVYKRSKRECYLKNAYDASQNQVKCDDCVAYNGREKLSTHKDSPSETTIPRERAMSDSSGIVNDNWYPLSSTSTARSTRDLTTMEKTTSRSSRGITIPHTSSVISSRRTEMRLMGVAQDIS